LWIVASAANEADFLMMNPYFGAWHGPREALGPTLDKVDRREAAEARRQHCDGALAGL
jgi:hypothetical protein